MYYGSGTVDPAANHWRHMCLAHLLESMSDQKWTTKQCSKCESKSTYSQ